MKRKRVRRRRVTKEARRIKPLRILITAGPTREYFDSIRYISNPSSGRMGYAIAAAAARRGHSVTLVSGPVELRAPAGVKVVRVVSAAEMLRAAGRAFERCDAAVFCAAVCDWRPARQAVRKEAKGRGDRVIRLCATSDIAATLGRRKGSRVTVGFALEDHDGRAHAAEKLRRKRFNLIVLNSPGALGEAGASVEVLAAGGSWTRWPTMSKAAIGGRLVRWMEACASRHGG